MKLGKRFNMVKVTDKRCGPVMAKDCNSKNDVLRKSTLKVGILSFLNWNFMQIQDLTRIVKYIILLVMLNFEVIYLEFDKNTGKLMKIQLFAINY